MFAKQFIHVQKKIVKGMIEIIFLTLRILFQNSFIHTFDIEF